MTHFRSIALVRSVLLAACAASLPGMPATGQDEHAGQQFARIEELAACRGCSVKWGCDLLTLLHERLVQKELAVTNEQTAAIDQAAQRYLAALAELAARSQGAKAKGKQFLAEQAKLRDRYGRQAVGLLNPEQQKRLGHIAFQLRSVYALFYPETAEALRFTQQQKAQIAAIRLRLINQGRKALGDLMGKEPNRGEFEKRATQLQSEAKQRVVSLLSESQRETLQRLEGPTISFSGRDLRLRIERKPAHASPPQNRDDSARSPK